MQPRPNQTRTLRSPISDLRSNESLEQAVPLNAARDAPHSANTPTHRQLVRLGHEVLVDHPSEYEIGALMELLKTAASRAGFTVLNSGDISRALDSALWQRRKLR
jgi:hypothetical protein